jgi:hypothetical protein
MSDLQYAQDVGKNMAGMTQEFNRKVIDLTIESLRSKYNERGLQLSEDVIERLKANWIKNLELRIRQNEDDAKQRHFEIL